MNLYHISQAVNNAYDTYSDAVVAAPDALTARQTNPSPYADEYSWTTPENVQVELIGRAAPHIEAGVIVSSFHAG
jgi:hypothetical protein